MTNDKTIMKDSLISRKYVADLLGVGLTDLYRKIQKLAVDLPEKGNKLPLSVVRQITKEYIAKYHTVDRKVQCFFNFKGGTGKTTLAYNISSLFYLMGYKILVIDCDPQGHATRSFLESDSAEYQSMFEVVASQLPIKSVIKEVMPEFDIIPSNVKLSFIDSQLSYDVRREEKLRNLIEPLKAEYDFIFLDVNPSLSILNRNVMVASDYVNIVCEPQPFSLAGMEMLLQEFYQLARISKEETIPYNIIINKFEPNFLSNLEVIATLKNTDELTNHICENIVRKCEDFNFSARNKIPVPFFTNKNKSNAKTDIVGLGKELFAKSTHLIENIKVSYAA